MNSKFYKGTTKSLRIAFLGFCIAAVGALVGLLGNLTGIQFVAIAAFVIVAAGVFVGFIGIARGWIYLILGKPDPRL